MHCFLVAYDIADDSRRNEVAALVLGYGRRVQYSVYSCILSPKKLEELRAALAPVVHHADDQILFVDLGPLSGRGAECVTSIGRKYSGSEWAPTII